MGDVRSDPINWAGIFGGRQSGDTPSGLLCSVAIGTQCEPTQSTAEDNHQVDTKWGVCGVLRCTFMS